VCASAVLVVVGAIYTGAGVYRLVQDVPGSFPIDLRLRWVEQHLFVQGLNPQTHGHPDPLLPPTHEVMRSAGGGYPPWAYSLGLLFVPPLDWTMTRWYFATISVLALAGIATAASARVGEARGPYSVIAAALPFANFAAAICLSYGQYAVVLSGLLMSAVLLLERGHGWRAGLVLGMTMVKPQLTALFVIGLLVWRRFTPAIVVAASVGAAAVMAALVVGESVVTMSSRSTTEAGYYFQLSHNPAIVFAEAQLGFRLGVPALAGFVTISMVWCSWQLRKSNDLLRLASVGVILAMFWTYRKHYDVAMMTIPLVAVWIQAVRTGRSRDFAMFFLVGLSIWLPIRDTQWNRLWLQAGHTAIWLGAAVFLVRTASLSASGSGRVVCERR
jgi:hypothetical protein